MSVSTAVTRPPAVHTAWILWLAFLGLALLSLIVTLVSSEGPGGAVGLGGVVLAAVAACSNKFREGANWARFVLTVIGALNIVANVGSLALILGSGSASDVSAVALVLSSVMPLVVIAALSFCYRREANAFFAAAKTKQA